jgi:hypothetical protein
VGQYINTDDVVIRLIGKVEFTSDLNDVNRMQTTLLARLISESEGHVEYDLSPRYATPFTTIGGHPFKGFLRDRPTNDLIRTMCELQAVIRVLETDFGRGTVVDSDKYAERLEKRYEKMLERLLRRKGGNSGDIQTGWSYPPLPNLALSYFNTEADDGYSGQVLVTSSGLGSFPLTRINDPSENFFNADLDSPGSSVLGGGDIPGGEG